MFQRFAEVADVTTLLIALTLLPIVKTSFEAGTHGRRLAEITFYPEKIHKAVIGTFINIFFYHRIFDISTLS